MWQTKDNKLYKKFTFDNFALALGFINRVGEIANELNHHPTLHNTYGTVELWLSTHDAGDIVTDKDKEFSRRVDQIVTGGNSEPTAVDEEVKLYADGGSRGNPGPSSSGYVIMDMKDRIIVERGFYLGITTNNQAEYNALKFGLEECAKLGARKINVYMDSLLVINQMKGLYRVKNAELRPIHQAITDFAKNFEEVTYTQVPRELNKLADAEVNKVLDLEENQK